MRIALLEDSSFIIDAWKLTADFDVEGYARPEDFYARYEADQPGLVQLVCIVTDYYFDQESDLTGDDVLAWVKLRQGPPVLLSTDGPRSTHAGSGFGAILEKQPLRQAELERVLASLRR
jgi:hypothetical protein